MLYTIVLALHILSAIAVFASLALDWLATAGLRRAERLQDARPWVWVLQVSAAFGPWARFAVLGFGLFLAFDAWSWQGWIIVALASWVALVLVSEGAFTGRTLRQMVALVNTEEADAAPFASQVRVPRMWALVLTRLGLAVGLVGDMTLKPSLVIGAIMVLVGAGVGLALSQLRLDTRRRTALVEATTRG
ncbi:MAG: hypothetical protein J2P36_02020 [Ktedonobacteraceae bacterium]|nr:hypothetical protein [Ktedonobacteraceae bacterium]